MEKIYKKKIKAYKLFRIMKDGTIAPLFIDKKARLPLGQWTKAEKGNHTKGYVYRPFWHCTRSPKAPHLSEKGRAWFEVEIKNYTKFKKPEHQGGIWYLADDIKVIKQVK